MNTLIILKPGVVLITLLPPVPVLQVYYHLSLPRFEVESTVAPPPRASRDIHAY